MNEANIIIDAVELKPNPVETGKQVIIKAKILKKVYAIEIESGQRLLTADGFIIERTE